MEGDALLENLKALPAPPLDRVLAERVRLRARAELAHQHARGPAGRLANRAARALAPLLVTGTTAAYLVWVARVLADLAAR
jgi:hypothetical protein